MTLQEVIFNLSITCFKQPSDERMLDLEGRWRSSSLSPSGERLGPGTLPWEHDYNTVRWAGLPSGLPAFLDTNTYHLCYSIHLPLLPQDTRSPTCLPNKTQTWFSRPQPHLSGFISYFYRLLCQPGIPSSLLKPIVLLVSETSSPPYSFHGSSNLIICFHPAARPHQLVHSSIENVLYSIICIFVFYPSLDCKFPEDRENACFILLIPQSFATSSS